VGQVFLWNAGAGVGYLDDDPAPVLESAYLDGVAGADELAGVVQQVVAGQEEQVTVAGDGRQRPRRRRQRALLSIAHSTV